MATPDDVQSLIDELLDRSRVQLRADLEGLVRSVEEASAAEQEEAARSARSAAEAAAGALVAGAISAERSSAEERLRTAVSDAEQTARATHEEALAVVQADLGQSRALLAAVETRAEEDLAAAVAAARANERQAVLAATSSLLEAIRAFDEAQSLTEVLDRLVHHASRQAARVAVLLLQDESLRGWKWVGFTGAAISIDLPLADGHLAARAARSGTTESVSAGPASAGVLTPAHDGRASVAIPVLIDGRVVAVLYGDDDGEDAPIVPSAWPELLEVPVRHASRCFEAMTARRMPDLVRASAAERAKRREASKDPALLGQAT